MNILTRFLVAQPLPGWLKPQRRRPANAAPARRAPLPSLLEDKAPPRTCGWFDSSHELHSGLLVLEHSPTDPLALGCLAAAAAPGVVGRGLPAWVGARRGRRPSRRKESASNAQAAEGAQLQPDAAA